MTETPENRLVMETLETWKGGPKAVGYYQPFTNEIHILNSSDIFQRTLIHERCHALRREKTTFKLAQVFAFPAFNFILFSIMLLLAVVGVFSSLIPFLSVATIFICLLFCHIYEEYKADLMVSQTIKEIKKNGGESQK
jgi:fatty acid desaturase